MKFLRVIVARLTHDERRSLLRLFVVVIAAAVLTGCSLPNKPGELSWDVHLYVPLDARSYKVSDLIGTLTVSPTGQSGIGMGTDSVLYFSSLSHLVISIHDSLTLDPMQFNLYKPEGLQDSNAIFLLADQRNRVYDGRISSGTLTLHAQGAADGTPQAVQITLPAIVINALGNPFVYVDTLYNGQPLDTVINLAGYRIQMADSTPQRFPANMHCSTPSAVSATLSSSRITFSYLDGQLQNLRLMSTTSGTKIDRPPQGWETVRPTTADAYVRVVRGMGGAQADVTAELYSYLFNAPLDSQAVNLRGFTLSADSSAVINGLGHMIAQYPDSAGATANIVINGRIRSYAIDTVRLDVEIRAPLRFTFGTVHYPGSVYRVDADNLSKIQSGTGIVRIWNRLPVGGRVFLVVSSDSNRVLASSALASDTLADVTMPIATVHDGRADSAAFAEFRVSLSDSTLSYMRHPPFFSRTDVTIPGNGRDTLIAHAADYLRVQVIADVQYRVGGEGNP